MRRTLNASTELKDSTGDRAIAKFNLKLKCSTYNISIRCWKSFLLWLPCTVPFPWALGRLGGLQGGCAPDYETTRNRSESKSEQSGSESPVARRIGRRSLFGHVHGVLDRRVESHIGNFIMCDMPQDSLIFFTPGARGSSRSGLMR